MRAADILEIDVDPLGRRRRQGLGQVLGVVLGEVMRVAADVEPRRAQQEEWP